MQRLVAPRACSIIYSLLVERADPRPFLLPANICPIVPITFLKASQPFKFIDISAETLNMDHTEALNSVRRGDIGGLLYAHTYGDPRTPDSLFAQIKDIDPSLLLIDDRCLCVPDLDENPNNLADVILYSTGYAKIVELGFGAFALLHDSVTSCRLIALPFQPGDLGLLENTYKSSIAQNQRFEYRDSDWLQSGPIELSWDVFRQHIDGALRKSLRHRRQINYIYTSCLPSQIQLSPDMQLWRFQIRVNNPRRIIERIFSAGLFASTHYPSLAGIMAPGRCIEAENLASQIINLFNDHHYTMPMAQRTCEIIIGSL
jgi:hypothetical protein